MNPLLKLLPKVVPYVSTLFKRKAVQGAVATAVSGVAAKLVAPTVVTDANIVQIIEAVANVIIALGTVVAAWKGRNVTLDRERDRAAV